MKKNFLCFRGSIIIDFSFFVLSFSVWGFSVSKSSFLKELFDLEMVRFLSLQILVNKISEWEFELNFFAMLSLPKLKNFLQRDSEMNNLWQVFSFDYFGGLKILNWRHLISKVGSQRVGSYKTQKIGWNFWVSEIWVHKSLLIKLQFNLKWNWLGQINIGAGN